MELKTKKIVFVAIYFSHTFKFQKIDIDLSDFKGHSKNEFENASENEAEKKEIKKKGFLMMKILRNLKCALSGLRQFLAAESPFKMMKNAFYFTLKALFVLKIFKFLSFGCVEKRLD